MARIVSEIRTKHRAEGQMEPDRDSAACAGIIPQATIPCIDFETSLLLCLGADNHLDDQIAGTKSDGGDSRRLFDVRLACEFGLTRMREE